MRIFVSYARVDKPYCVQIVEVLDFHDVWFDQRLSAGQKWWKEILNRLEWCEGFIYLISHASLESEYCHREFEIAQSLGKHIFPTIIEPGLTLPDTLSHLQYIDLGHGLTAETVHDLLRAIYIADQTTWRPTPEEIVPSITPEPLDENALSDLISEAAQVMEKGEYDRATLLLKHVLAHNYRPRFIDINKLAAEAEAALERQTMRRQMEREYRQIVELVHLPATRQIGLEAFQAFQQDYKDYDPENIAAASTAETARGATGAGLGSESPSASPRPPDLLTRANERSRRIPLMEWCEISAGKVRVTGSDDVSHRHVDRFLMVRYPVTNKQYQAFVNASNGYNNAKWWAYSDEAIEWREGHPQPVPPKFEGHDRPRESITWYEARAFCLWLSDLLKLDITLPTLKQRQRAVMGDDERIYPWGNTFDQDFCNTRESGLRMTTVVNRYPNGVSPYGVYDLAGNVWEWCADHFIVEEPQEEGSDHKRLAKAIVHGGAFVSPYDRCHIGTSYSVPPQTAFASIGFRLICLG